ncbi:MAG: DUF1090 domain-containing protein [Vibrio sp.]
MIKTIPTAIAAGVSALLLTTTFTVQAAQDCSTQKGCDAKICHIENKIERATQANNSNRVKGLQKALADVQTYCTDDGLKEKLREDIADAQEDIRKDQADMSEAISEGKLDKVDKYKRRIAEEQNKIQQLQTELDSF